MLARAEIICAATLGGSVKQGSEEESYMNRFQGAVTVVTAQSIYNSARRALSLQSFFVGIWVTLWDIRLSPKLSNVYILQDRFRISEIPSSVSYTKCGL